MTKTLTVILLLISALSFAQTKATLKGSVIDSATKAPLEFATVAIVNVKDTSLISYTLSLKNGSFKLTGLPIGYDTKLIVSYAGCNTFRKTLVFKAGEERDMGVILMAGKSLKEVVIHGERSPVVIKKDTIEFNTEAFKTRPNAVVEDLLRLLPGVQVNYDGTITVNGKGVSKLMIDGKQFFGNDPKVATKNLDAEMVDKIQVYDDREDDPDHKLTGNKVKKIINLKMKSKIKKSTLGKVYAGIGSRDRYEAGGIVSNFRDTLQVSVIGVANNLNRTGFSYSELYNMGGFNRSGGSQHYDGTFGGRGWGGIESVASTGFNINNDYGKKLKMNLTYFYTKTDRIDRSNSLNEQTLDQTVLSSLSSDDSHNTTHKHAFGGLVEWAPDTMMRIKYEPKFNLEPQYNTNKSFGSSFNTQTPKLTESTDMGSQHSSNTSFSHSFSFYHKLKKKGESIEISHNLSLNKSGSDGFSFNQIASYVTAINSQVLDRFSGSNAVSNSGGISITYNYPFTKKLRTELSSNTRYITTSDRMSLFDRNTTSGLYDLLSASLSKDLSRNTFIQNIKPKFNYKFTDEVELRLGVDFEMQNVRNKFSSMGAYQGKQYYFFFPVVEFSGPHYSLGYSESIEQPGIDQMRPGVRVYSQLNKEIGNPDLAPSRIHNVNGNYYTYNEDKQFNTNIYTSFTLTDNNVVSKNTIDTVGATTSTYLNRNGGWRAYVGGSFGKQFKKSKKWQIGLESNYNFNYSRGAFFLNADEGVQSNYYIDAGQGINFNYNSIISLNTKYDISLSLTKYNGVDYASVKTVKHTIGSDVTVRWPKRIVFDAKYSYGFSTQVAPVFPRSSNILNLAVAMLMLKKDRGQIKLSVYDLFDQNISVYRYAGGNSVYNTEQQILKRYFLLTYQYKLNIFKSK